MQSKPAQIAARPRSQATALRTAAHHPADRPQPEQLPSDGVLNDYSKRAPGSVLRRHLGVGFAIQRLSSHQQLFRANYGQEHGGVVNAITRSGTNTVSRKGHESSATARWMRATSLI